MANVVQREPITDGVCASLAIAGCPVGDHEAPRDTTERYSIVRAIPGGSLDGSMAYPSEDGVFVYRGLSCTSRCRSTA